MSTVMEEEFKRWTAKCKTALVTEIIQGKTSVAEASRTYDLPPSEVEEWVEKSRKDLENALRVKPLDIREKQASESLRRSDAGAARARKKL